MHVLLTIRLISLINSLQSLSPDQYKTAMRLIEHAILSTDLAIYFKKKTRFINMVDNGEFDWQDPGQKSRKY